MLSKASTTVKSNPLTQRTGLGSSRPFVTGVIEAQLFTRLLLESARLGGMPYDERLPLLGSVGIGTQVISEVHFALLRVRHTVARKTFVGSHSENLD